MCLLALCTDCLAIYFNLVVHVTMTAQVFYIQFYFCSNQSSVISATVTLLANSKRLLFWAPNGSGLSVRRGGREGGVEVGRTEGGVKVGKTEGGVE